MEDDPEYQGPDDFAFPEQPSPHQEEVAEDKPKKRTKEEKEERRRRKQERRERKRQEKENRRRKRQRQNEEEDAAQKGNKKTRKKAQITEEDAINRVRTFIDQAEKAARDDIASVEAGKPALEKLQLIDTLVQEVLMPKWSLWYLREGICSTLGKWLSILPGNTLPNTTVRSQVLQVLEKLPLLIGHLQEDCCLGPALVALWKHKDETEENRDKICAIIDKLLRPLLAQQMSSSYQHLMQRPQEPAEFPPIPVGTRTITRAAIPRITGHTFKVMPRSDFHGIQQDHGKDGVVTRVSRRLRCRR